MKGKKQKLSIIISLISLTFFISSVQAEDLCFIKWEGDFNGCAVTSETSKTQQAAYEIFKHLFGQEDQVSWSDDCYSGSSQHVYKCLFAFNHFGVTCVDGTWNDEYYLCEDNLNECNWDLSTGFGCQSPYFISGTWDVICEQESDFDCDSDGIHDVDDDCPFEHSGYDANDDGCYDNWEDLPVVIQGLNIKNYGTEKKLIKLELVSRPYFDENGALHIKEEVMELISFIGKKAGNQITQEDADVLIDFIKNLTIKIPLDS